MKRCSRCKEEKSEASFYRSKASKDGLECRCKACNAASNDVEKRRASQRAWYLANLDSIKKRESYGRNTGRWQINNPEKWAAYISERRKVSSNLLDDEYVRRLLSTQIGCKGADVPDDLVKAHRAVLRMKRLIKEQQA